MIVMMCNTKIAVGRVWFEERDIGNKLVVHSILRLQPSYLEYGQTEL